MMKWRRKSSIDSEVKSSLDILDSVLAEYEQEEDDELVTTFNSWNEFKEQNKEVEANVDDVTRRNNTLPAKKVPPAVPKRDPQTRLSFTDDPYGLALLPRPVPISVGQHSNKRPNSLPSNGGFMSTFGHVSSPITSIPISDYVANFSSRSKTLPSDFRQSLHFNIYGSSDEEGELCNKEAARTGDSIENGKKRRSKRKFW